MLPVKQAQSGSIQQCKRASSGGWFPSRRSRATHDPQQVTKVFKFAEPAHTQCPFGSHIAGFETMDFSGVGTTLPTSFSLRPSGFSAMCFTDPLALDCWSATLKFVTLGLGLASLAGYPPTKGEDVLFKK